MSTSRFLFVRVFTFFKYMSPLIMDFRLISKCSIAKTAFEMGKVSQGFEALARGQYLLRSKTSLENLPLLNQVNVEAMSS